MPENKTKATNVSVSAYIEGLTDPTRRSEARELVEVMQRASGEKPKLWGPSIVGFGSYHYKYDSGREGDMPLISFSPRKAAMVLYSMLAHTEAKAVLANLGDTPPARAASTLKSLRMWIKQSLRHSSRMRLPTTALAPTWLLNGSQPLMSEIEIFRQLTMACLLQ